MSNEQPLYGKIFKNVVLLGGVQVVQVLTTIIRGKFVVLFLGAAGIGVNALFTSVILVLVQFSGLGIQYSAVRELSMATAGNDTNGLRQIVHVFRYWLYACAILGGIITLLLAIPLSHFSFGNTNYTYAFMLASVVVATNVLYNGNISLLQGTHQLSKLAVVTLLGAFTAMLTVIPVYYIWGMQGIMPAILIASLLAYSISWFYTRPIKGGGQQQSIKSVFTQGRSMAELGILIMLSNLLVNAALYLINTFIRSTGSLNDVGLYSAGVSITNQYIGVIFTALAADYFPKLSAIVSDAQKVKATVSSQTEIVMLVSAPILGVMMLTAPLLIRILLSESFLSITNFIQWAALGMFLKATSFAAGYISFAKGDKKTFFFLEGIIGSLLILLTSTAGYWLGGVAGVAKGVLVCYAIYLAGIHLVCKRLYHYQPGRYVIVLFLKLATLLTCMLLSLLVLPSFWGYITAGLFMMAISYLSYVELDRRIMLQKFMRAKFKR